MKPGALIVALAGMLAFAAGETSVVTFQKGEAQEFAVTLEGGKRACVLFVGDHKPVQDLKIQVFDRGDNLVTESSGEGDIVCAVWYPLRTETFRVSLTNGTRDWNRCVVVVKQAP